MLQLLLMLCFVGSCCSSACVHDEGRACSMLCGGSVLLCRLRSLLQLVHVEQLCEQ
jgi:hypothetical protein